MLREEAGGWHRRLGHVEAEAGRTAAGIDSLRDRLVVTEERARAEGHAAAQAAVLPSLAHAYCTRCRLGLTAPTGTPLLYAQAAAVHVKTLGSDLMSELQARCLPPLLCLRLHLFLHVHRPLLYLLHNLILILHLHHLPHLHLLHPTSSTPPPPPPPLRCRARRPRRRRARWRSA